MLTYCSRYGDVELRSMERLIPIGLGTIENTPDVDKGEISFKENYRVSEKIKQISESKTVITDGQMLSRYLSPVV